METSSYRYCGVCGQPLEPGATVCGNCGAAVEGGAATGATGESTVAMPAAAAGAAGAAGGAAGGGGDGGDDGALPPDDDAGMSSGQRWLIAGLVMALLVKLFRYT